MKPRTVSLAELLVDGDLRMMERHENTEFVLQPYYSAGAYRQNKIRVLRRARHLRTELNRLPRQGIE